MRRIQPAIWPYMTKNSGLGRFLGLGILPYFIPYIYPLGPVWGLTLGSLPLIFLVCLYTRCTPDAHRHQMYIDTGAFGVYCWYMEKKLKGAHLDKFEMKAAEISVLFDYP